MRSTFKILFYLKRDKQKSNGMIPLYCRITVDGQEARFGMKCDIQLAKELKIDRHIYTILQIIGFSLHDKTPVKQLFTTNNYKNIKEQDYNLLLFN